VVSAGVPMRRPPGTSALTSPCKTARSMSFSLLVSAHIRAH
jgi:hypothetical protein